MRVHFAHAVHVVLVGLLERRVEVLADADAADAAVAAAREPRHQMIDALVVESHAIDQRAAARRSEHARFRIAGLRPRRHGAEFDVAEAERPERVEIVAVLVESRGESQRVRKLQIPGSLRARRRPWQRRPTAAAASAGRRVPAPCANSGSRARQDGQCRRAPGMQRRASSRTHSSSCACAPR